MSKNTNLSFLTDYITADITNGRIGINNASPTVAFDVSGATKISGALTLTSTISNGTYTYTLPSSTGTLALTSAISGTTNYVPKFTASGTIGNSLIYDNGTNVGIGTTSPTAKLEIYDNSNSGILRLSRDAGGQRGALEFGRNNGGSFQTCGSIIVDSDIASVNNGLMYFYTSNSAGTNTERMRIPSAGGLLINATSSAYGSSLGYNLGVKGTSTQSLISIARTGQVLDSQGMIIGLDTATAYFSILDNIPLAFATNNAERMRITSGGDILVGTTTNGGPSITSVRAGLISGQRDSSADYVLQAWNQATTGDNKFISFYTDTGTLRGGIDYNRSAGLVRYNTTSDANLKNIIGDADTQKSIDILNSTKIREYSWKDDKTNKSQIGIIAQELYETFKGAVSKGSSNELYGSINYKNWGVDKTAFTFHLIAGWQKHEQIIQELSEQNTSLINRIEALENK